MEYKIKNLQSIDSLEIARELSEMNVTEQFTFDADFNWARPFGMLYAATVIKQFRKTYSEFPFNIIAQNKDAISYASHMAFFKTISESIRIGKEPGEASGNSNYIPITKIDLHQLHRNEIESGNFIEMGDAIEKKASALSRILSRENKEIHALLTYLIREILRNIPEHSNSNIAWICGQYWNDNSAEIAILDEGIGIKESLRKNLVHKEYIKTDEDALQCAIRAGISQAFQPSKKNKSDDTWSNSGFGLYMVSQICKELKGTFCLASGENYIWLQHDKEIRMGKTHFQGTAVKISISTRELKNSQSIINKIAQQGENQARTIRNAFKKASIPSKGLINSIE